MPFKTTPHEKARGAGGAETRILLPTHLFPPRLVPEPRSRCVVLEDPGYFRGPTGDFRLHVGRLAYARAACSAYCAERKVRHVPLERAEAWLRDAAADRSARYVVWDPLDSSVLRRLSGALGGRLRVDPRHPGFVVRDPGGYGGPVVLKSVLAHCRSALGVLEGQGSTDAENRDPPDGAMRSAVASLDSKRGPYGGRHMDDAVRWAGRTFEGHPGDVEAARKFPYTRRQALSALRLFLRSGLPSYGPYQDAVLTGGATTFGVHSGLSAAMNLGLIGPGECAARAAAELAAGRAPLQSVEAYVRQLLGWREYSRLVYWAHGPALERRVFAGYPRLGEGWYDGGGSLEPLAECVRRANSDAYLDHISRLMVAGSLGVMSGAHPGGLLRWFTELVAADAHQWAMVSNLAHMGGMEVPAGEGKGKKKARRLSRRAYVSSSAYLRRMTDLPPGEWEGLVDGLFYAYLERAPPGSEYYRASLRGERYRSNRAGWKKLALRAARTLS